jgi:hypothetical protein
LQLIALKTSRRRNGEVIRRRLSPKEETAMN